MINDIYEEKKISRIDINNPKKEYPLELILNIDSIESPTIGKMAMSIRNYIIECQTSDINGTIVFNFMIDLLNPALRNELNYLSEQKFVTLAEYVEDMKSQFSNINFALSVRGYFLMSMSPLLFINIPYKVSPLTLFLHSDNIGDCLSKFITSKNITNFTPELITSLIYNK